MIRYPFGWFLSVHTPRRAFFVAGRERVDGELGPVPQKPQQSTGKLTLPIGSIVVPFL